MKTIKHGDERDLMTPRQRVRRVNGLMRDGRVYTFESWSGETFWIGPGGFAQKVRLLWAGGAIDEVDRFEQPLYEVYRRYAPGTHKYRRATIVRLDDAIAMVAQGAKQ